MTICRGHTHARDKGKMGLCLSPYRIVDEVHDTIHDLSKVRLHLWSDVIQLFYGVIYAQTG
jgi:hypothetical protein